MAQIVVRETREVRPEVRAGITADLAEDLPELGPRQAEAAARRLAFAADPFAVLARARAARAEAFADAERYASSEGASLAPLTNHGTLINTALLASVSA